MNKLLVLSALLVTLFSFGQTVDGITIGRSEKEVISKLTEKGFKYQETKVADKDTKKYVGKLSNGDNVTITISSTPHSKIVWKLIISNTSNTWKTAKSQFEAYSDILTNKYGESAINIKSFNRPYAEGDNHELLALFTNNCEWQTFWLENHNTIALDISSMSTSQADVNIIYENAKGSEIYTKETTILN